MEKNGIKCNRTWENIKKITSLGEAHLIVDQTVRMGHLSQSLRSLDPFPSSLKQMDHSGMDKTCILQWLVISHFPHMKIKLVL